MEILIAVFIGFGLDLLLGDPVCFPHPVRAMGRVIAALEKTVRRILPKTNFWEYIGGMILTLVTCSLFLALPLLLLAYAGKINLFCRIALESLFCYQLLATKCLQTESMKVHCALEKRDLQEARKSLSYIVGRDTAELGEQKIIMAAVETVAENTGDGVVAPLLYMLIGGAPLAFLYKAINTLDSMIGYKNEKYLYFGRFAAKLDDAANLLPAWVAAYVMIGASWFFKLDFGNAWRIYKRDRHNHASPNSARTEAVCAGALQIQLGGNSYYFGKWVQKQTIGEDLRPPISEDIQKANQLMYGTAFGSLLLFGGLRMLGVMLF